MFYIFNVYGLFYFMFYYCYKKLYNYNVICVVKVVKKGCIFFDLKWCLDLNWIRWDFILLDVDRIGKCVKDIVYIYLFKYVLFFNFVYEK